MGTIIKAGISNPMVRRVAAELAYNLAYEVGAPLVKNGARKVYKGITRSGHRRWH